MAILSSLFFIFAIIFFAQRLKKQFDRERSTENNEVKEDDRSLTFLPSFEEHSNINEVTEEEELRTMSYICVLDDWEINRKQLTITDSTLGRGCFGVVKKGIYHDKDQDIYIAVKMLKDSVSIADRNDLLMELRILKDINKTPHRNVIKLIGAVTNEEPVFVVTELCARGNLRKLLQNSRILSSETDKNSFHEYKNIFSTLSHTKLIQIAVDIANGMHHLEKHKFVHRDLSARNILIGENFEAKVSDFGLARPIAGVDEMYIKSHRNLLPVKWMALESLTQGIFVHQVMYGHLELCCGKYRHLERNLTLEFQRLTRLLTLHREKEWKNHHNALPHYTN
ncbi:fibroblast growth factor receptor 4-like [Xenia sp. Carnegie-2017]|uniref:fibroblast growth factor receptor 4-like n=1 Tax=Xenia sp. Carnegie-2017 TaxID=2897299 RepID=UPI001F0467AC|nr:fibroblast growth factor receptor 4-like [Xenia sp. Carnegie-2017]